LRNAGAVQAAPVFLPATENRHAAHAENAKENGRLERRPPV